MGLLLLLGAAQPLLLGVELGLHRQSTLMPTNGTGIERGLHRHTPPPSPPLMPPPSSPSPPLMPPPSSPSPPPPPPSSPSPPPPPLEGAVVRARGLFPSHLPSFVHSTEEGGIQRTTSPLFPGEPPPFEGSCTAKLRAHFPFESPVLDFLYATFALTRFLGLCLGCAATRNFGHGLRERVHLPRQRHDSSSLPPSESSRDDTSSPDADVAGGCISAISAISAAISVPSSSEVASAPRPSPSRSSEYSVPFLDGGDRISERISERTSGPCVPVGGRISGGRSVPTDARSTTSTSPALAAAASAAGDGVSSLSHRHSGCGTGDDRRINDVPE